VGPSVKLKVKLDLCLGKCLSRLSAHSSFFKFYVKVPLMEYIYFIWIDLTIIYSTLILGSYLQSHEPEASCCMSPSVGLGRPSRTSETLSTHLHSMQRPSMAH
jgi:hypothetical protein